MKIYRLLVKMWSIIDYANWIMDVKFVNFFLPNRKKDPRIEKNKKFLNDPESPVGVLKRFGPLYFFPFFCGHTCVSILYLLIGCLYPKFPKILGELIGVDSYIVVTIGYVLLVGFFVVLFWRTLNEATNNSKIYFEKYNNYPPKKKRNITLTGAVLSILFYISFIALPLLMIIVLI